MFVLTFAVLFCFLVGALLTCMYIFRINSYFWLAGTIERAMYAWARDLLTSAAHDASVSSSLFLCGNIKKNLYVWVGALKFV
jgi:hypothetical protein